MIKSGKKGRNCTYHQCFCYCRRKRMKALVTGGTGFLGSHIVDELVDSGYDVRVMARETSDTTRYQKMKGVELVVGDITRPHLQRRHRESILQVSDGEQGCCDEKT